MRWASLRAWGPGGLGRCGDQGVWADPYSCGVLRREHRDEVERFVPDIDERVRHAGRNFYNVGCLDGECLVADTVLDVAFEQHVCLFGAMCMESGTGARMRLGDDERERLKTILVAGEAVCELAGRAISVFHLVEIKKERSRVVRLLRRARKVLVRQLFRRGGRGGLRECLCRSNRWRAAVKKEGAYYNDKHGNYDYSSHGSTSLYL